MSTLANVSHIAGMSGVSATAEAGGSPHDCLTWNCT
jgi:hypothetical protein